LVIVENSLVGNINKRKKVGTSRSKKKLTVSDKSYKGMKAKGPLKKNMPLHHGEERTRA
jgi:hypothetical protein